MWTWHECQASWWSQPTWGPPFWARPSWMSGTGPAQGGLWTPPRGPSSSQQGIRGPLTLGPGWWAIPPSSPPPWQLKGGGMSGSGRHSRATRPACLSGRPFGRMAGTLLPRRSQGIRAAEQCQLRQVGGLPTAGPAPARKRRRDETDAATPTSQFPRHPSIPRPPVAERIASREPLEGGRPGPPRARLTDCTDVLTPLSAGRPRSPWHHVWGAVAHSGLSFVEGACTWRVLHGCVFTGAFKSYVSMPVSPADRFCTHSTCGALHYDTLSHVFLTCPIASQVWSWLGTL